MKNYIYIHNTQAIIKIYYTQAKTKAEAIHNLENLEDLKFGISILDINIIEVKNTECIYDYDYPDYEG